MRMLAVDGKVVRCNWLAIIRRGPRLWSADATGDLGHAGLVGEPSWLSLSTVGGGRTRLCQKSASLLVGDVRCARHTEQASQLRSNIVGRSKAHHLGDQRRDREIFDPVGIEVELLD